MAKAAVEGASKKGLGEHSAFGIQAWFDVLRILQTPFGSAVPELREESDSNIICSCDTPTTIEYLRFEVRAEYRTFLQGNLGPMKSEFDVVLFDNDGVLVDTEPLFFRATQEILESVGVSLTDDVYREICLVRGQSVFDLAERQGATANEVSALRARRDVRYADLIGLGVSVLAGVQNTLVALDGIRPMAVVTSSERSHFEKIHRQTGLLKHFKFALTNGDYARHKPYPDPYLNAAARFGVAPSRCLVIEDSERGLTAAHAAGMRCIVIPQPLSRESDFSRAEFVLRSMEELLGVLEI